MKTSTLLLLSCLSSLAACIGYDRMLFTTKSNVGVDLDTSPPTFDVTIARREVVIEPTFQDGKTPPVMASFSSKVGGLSRFFAGVAMTFATGDAAVALARFTGTQEDGTAKADGSASDAVTRVDSAEDVGGALPGGGKIFATSPYTNGHSTPLVFGTDSSLGLKVGWSGMDLYPTTLKFGFNRKELAIAPIFATKTNVDGKDVFRVKVPSLLATLNSDTSIGKANENETNRVRYLQYFATGRAATELALKRNVREPVLELMAGGALNDLLEKNTDLAARVVKGVEKVGEDQAAVLEELKGALSSAGFATWSQRDFAGKKDALIQSLKSERFAQPTKEQTKELEAALEILKRGGFDR
ncbi:MAG: hypothetical protein HZB39_18100 [Planctomycetes bacterium]|nr:hypothetical protein [Planctomycetota bacterium]